MESGRAQIMMMQLLSFVRILPGSFKRKAYMVVVRPLIAGLGTVLVNALDHLPDAGNVGLRRRRPPEWPAVDAPVPVAGYRMPIRCRRGCG
jgi:hypothetical protein